MIIASLAIGCSKEDEKDPGINHVGEQWKVISGEFTLVDLTVGGGGIKMGSAADAGSFYFDGDVGSFDLTLQGVRKEDVFSYTEENGSITIISVSQSVDTKLVSQSVIALSGERDNESMTLSGTVVKQGTGGSTTGAFTLTLTDLELRKQ